MPNAPPPSVASASTSSFPSSSATPKHHRRPSTPPMATPPPAYRSGPSAGGPASTPSLSRGGRPTPNTGSPPAAPAGPEEEFAMREMMLSLRRSDFTSAADYSSHVNHLFSHALARCVPLSEREAMHLYLRGLPSSTARTVLSAAQAGHAANPSRWPTLADVQRLTEHVERVREQAFVVGKWAAQRGDWRAQVEGNGGAAVDPDKTPVAGSTSPRFADAPGQAFSPAPGYTSPRTSGVATFGDSLVAQAAKLSVSDKQEPVAVLPGSYGLGLGMQCIAPDAPDARNERRGHEAARPEAQRTTHSCARRAAH